jgi:hypothetical protein
MVDIKFYKPVSATFSGVAGAPGSFPTPVAPGAPAPLTLTTIGTGYSTIINSDGSLEVELVTDDSAATATPTGVFVAAIHRTTLPTYTDGDGALFHLDNRGRLLVSTGEGSITADVEVDQDPAPATPAGSFISMKYEAALPTYAAGDAATLHADARGRLLVAAIDLATGSTQDMSTEDSAGPTNPVGAFSLGLYRTTLPTYTDGDAANFHFSGNGRLLVSSGGLPAISATSTVAGAASSTSLLASNASRSGATLFNEQPTDGTGEILFLLLDAAAASTSNYTVQVPINSYYEVPFGYTGEIRGIWGAAVGDVRVTELT